MADLRESTTSSKQPHPPVMMKLQREPTSSRTQTDCVCKFMDNCPNLPATMVEEGISGIAPSSPEISFPTHYHSTYLNTTHTNMKRHAKTRANSPRKTTQNHQQNPKRKLKSLAFTLKIFFCTHTNHPSLGSGKPRTTVKAYIND